MRRAALAGISLAAIALASAGCGSGGGVAVPGGNAERGKAVIAQAGCGACHTIAGVDGADGTVGPSLDGISRRRTIAGRLSNTPDNLARWIRAPQQLDPGNLMPDLGLDRADARDIAAYLDRN